MPLLFIRTLLFFYLALPAMAGNQTEKSALHPLHVSTADISYNKQDEKMEVICKIFTDDFELALAKQFSAKTDLQKPEMHAAMDALVKNYLNLNLHLKSNNAALPLTYIGYEINKEYAVIYLESEKTALPKKIDAEVTLLYNLFNDQINIVHMTVNGTRKSGRIDYPDKTIAQSF